MATAIFLLLFYMQIVLRFYKNIFIAIKGIDDIYMLMRMQIGIKVLV